MSDKTPPPVVVGIVTEKARAKTEKAAGTAAPKSPAAHINSVAQQQAAAALLNEARDAVSTSQLTLFEIAPWADHMRALPNDYARSSLFSTRNKRVPRAALQGHEIYHLHQDVSITFTGVELRADDDELVWQQVLNYAKHVPLGSPVTFTFYALLKDLGWSINSRYYEKAEECLTRLQATALSFYSKRVGNLDSISMIRRFRVLDKGKRGSRCQVEIDSDMVMLFAGEHYTKVIWDKYKRLKPTARRLFDYFASHQKPFPLKLNKFRLLCNSDSNRPNKWREQVIAACQELKASGLVTDAWVLDDEAHCTR